MNINIQRDMLDSVDARIPNTHNKRQLLSSIVDDKTMAIPCKASLVRNEINLS